jgi:lipoprotein-anchoring transpeptidase ErfK/SrfK
MGWPNGRRRQWSAALGVAVLVGLSLGLVIATHPNSADAQPEHTTAAADGPAVDTVRPVVSITPATALDPDQPIVVSVARGTARTVAVKDTSDGKAVAGALDAGGTTWTSSGTLAYGTTYAVGVDTVDAGGTPGHQDLTVATVDPKTQAYPSFIPPPGQATVGVGQPIVVRFNHPVKDHAAAQKALSVTSSAGQTGAWYWLSDTDVHYRASTYWTANSTLTLKADLFGVDLGGGTFGETDRTETIHVHDAWVAKADGATEQMQIFDNGALVTTMPISLGSPGHPSHIGPHVISDKQPSITMDSCTYGVCQGQPGYYKEKVDLDERISDDGEFVHSAPWSVGSQGGQNVSHGCVNLSPANAQWFFDHFGIGDVVEITNSGGPQLPLDDTYGDWELTWAQWQKGSAL